MKIRAISFIFKEGLTNIFRNKLMFFASCAIMSAALIILGIFLLLIFNIDENVRALDELPQIQAFCRFEVTERDADGVAEDIDAIAEELGAVITDFHKVTKDEAFGRAQELFGRNADLIKGLGKDYLPVSFTIKLEDPEQIYDFASALEEIPRIEKVNYPKDTIDFIVNISKWTKAFGAVLAGIPILFAVFIISNTIRIAVFERRAEIGIMRYIGATENAVRWPFVVEGAFTGAVGAIIAFVTTSYGYKFAEKSFNVALAGAAGNQLRLIGAGNVTASLLALFLCIGVGIGALGSVRSVNKYLRLDA